MLVMDAESGSTVRLRERLTVRLTAGVILALLMIGVPFLLAFLGLSRDQHLEVLAEASAGMSRVLVDSLRSAMLAGEPHLLDQAIRDLARQPEVERVVVLDRKGVVRISSDPAFQDRVFERSREPTCQVCHLSPEALPSSRTLVVEDRGRQVLRAMSIIPNDAGCHSCHDPSLPTNGVLLMDLSLRSANQSFLAGITSTALLGSVMVAVTIAVLVVLLHRMVHEPLRAVVSTSRSIVGGNLDARVPLRSVGEFAILSTQVNRMTDHLARSIQAEESHRRELQAILDSVDDEIVVLDRDRRVVAANQAFLLASRTADPILGKSCREVSALRPCSENPSLCPVEEVLQGGHLQKGIMSRIDEKGAERAIEIHASPVRGADGAVDRVVEVRRDISERRQMEATLAASERLTSLGLLASGISHEVNNPLGAIAASVEGLRRKLARKAEDSRGVEEDFDRTLVRIAREVQRARAITDRLLKVARPPGRSRSLIDVNHAVAETLALLSYDIERTGIEATTELAEKLPPLSGDESRLGQILMNLTLNAIQAIEATGGGGKLLLATAVEDGAIRIDVEDTGEGIATEAIGRIYEPFFTTKPAGKGTGLGLFITHRLVSEMNGAIDVRSKPGEGTRFTVLLPFWSRGRSIP
jgi:PAS domain S-box-containing protein